MPLKTLTNLLHLRFLWGRPVKIRNDVFGRNTFFRELKYTQNRAAGAYAGCVLLMFPKLPQNRYLCSPLKNRDDFS